MSKLPSRALGTCPGYELDDAFAALVPIAYRVGAQDWPEPTRMEP